jgi:hypothetical protein
MQLHAVMFVPKNVHTAVSYENNKRKLLNLATVTFQGQQVQDDDGVILIIFACLHLSCSVINAFLCSQYNVFRAFR